MRKFITYIAVLIGFYIGTCYAVSDIGRQDPLTLMEQGQYRQAIDGWRFELSQLPEDGANHERATLHQRIADALVKLGYLYQARDELLEAEKVASQSKDETLLYIIRADAANVQISLGNTRLARESLSKCLDYFRQHDLHELEAAVLNDIGRALWIEADSAGAEKSFMQSAALAVRYGLVARSIVAELNHTLLLLKLKQYQKAEQRLAIADSHIAALKAGLEKEQYQLTSAEILLQIMREPALKNRSVSEAFVSEMTAVYLAAKQHNHHWNESYSLGLLGIAYADTKNYSTAVRYFDRAISLAQNYNYPELLFRWQWRAGRVTEENGQLSQALTYYQNAYVAYLDIGPINTLEKTVLSQKSENPSDYFYEMADITLRIADKETDVVRQQALYLSAIDAIESLKNTELQDYFKDDCVARAKKRHINARQGQEKSVAVLYIIAFNERLELIVKYADKIKRYSSPVSKSSIVNMVTDYRARVEKRHGRDFVPTAKKLYDAVMAPLNADLDKNEIDTLVVIPDISLRSLPFSALFDGEKFLIEKYALTLSPGMELTETRSAQRNNTVMMLGGLSKSVQGYPKLNYVETELLSIKNIFGGDMLLDSEFNNKNINKLFSNETVNIAHLATHGEFRDDVSQSYILTYDGKITVNDLAKYIGTSQFHDQPIELLTLSACYTASGDERAMLGLAGITVKSGAVSALATLWPVNDIATSILMTEFYTQYKDIRISKSRALQLAQIKLLDDKRYRHPGYWSPFVLIGNWQ